MARIVYGVSGEGSGHAARAGVILAHLAAKGHQVKVASYDRAYRALRERFDVLEIEGLSIGTSDNQVSLVRTFTENLSKLSDGVRSLRAMKSELFERFRPDVAITDFEPMTAHLARHFDVPLATIDNQHAMRYVEFECPPELRKQALVTQNVVRAMVPKPDVSLVTTFHRGPLANRRTFLFAPIVRPEVLALAPQPGERVLVYFTKGFDSCVELLRGTAGQHFVVYGYDRDAREGNLEFKHASGAGFLADLAAAKAVISTAGFSLMSEALHLGKPMLALPMQGQFEQEFNAILLASSGFGANGRACTGETIAEFLRRVPEYAANLRRYARSDNGALTAKLDELLANGASLAREFHARRDELGAAPAASRA